MTREQLEARAAELGITIQKSMKDATIAKRIAAAEAELTSQVAGETISGDTTTTGEDTVVADETSAGVRGGGTSGEGGRAGEAEGSEGPSADLEIDAIAVVDEEAAIEEQIKTRGALIVTGPQRGRWRAGHKFGPGETTLFLDDLSEEDVQAIQGDPVLSVKHIQPAGA